ncbi:HNH endonuclease signature motif containing protein [Serratia sp. IR-2025]
MEDNYLTPEMVLLLVGYNPETGKFHWKHRNGLGRATKIWNSRFAYTECATIGSSGYIRIRLYGVVYQAHRIAWLLTYGSFPNGIIDHINRVRTDNRLANLRIATHSENMQNRKNQINNKSGFRGVSWDEKYGKWRARINAGGKCINLGYHETAELASSAFELARIKYHRI